MKLTHALALLACSIPLGCSASTASNVSPNDDSHSTDSQASTISGSKSAQVAAPALDGSKATIGSGLYSLGADDIDGKPQPLSQYVGKVALVVNTASRCGFTPQYEGLEKLYSELAPRGFVVLGFPSNDFGAQEPGSEADIKAFCSDKYNVTFPMFAKVATKSGAEQSPIYEALGKATGNLPSWNFCKYLIGKDGKVLAFFPSKVTPSDIDLRTAIEDALAAK